MESSHAEASAPARSRALGYAAGLAVVLVTAIYPALTQWSVVRTLTPADLLLFRVGVAGLLFLPYLIRRAPRLSRRDWLSALPLSFLHGWGMIGCVLLGLEFAPASHAAALGPGTIALWVAVIGFAVYRIQVPTTRIAGIAAILVGVALVLGLSPGAIGMRDAWLGDLLFLAAAALGATFLVYIQQRRIDPMLAAGLVCVTSALLVVPWHLYFAVSTLRSAPPSEILWQLLFQGVVVGCLAFVALNYATLAIGSQAMSMLSALVPVIGALCSLWILGEPISGLEWLAIVVISGGVAVGSLPRGRRTAPVLQAP